MEIKDVYPEPLPNFNVDLKYDYVHQLIGKEIPHDTIKSIVSSLEMVIKSEDAEGLQLECLPIVWTCSVRATLWKTSCACMAIIMWKCPNS